MCQSTPYYSKRDFKKSPPTLDIANMRESEKRCFRKYENERTKRTTTTCNNQTQELELHFPPGHRGMTPPSGHTSALKINWDKRLMTFPLPRNPGILNEGQETQGQAATIHTVGWLLVSPHSPLIIYN